MQPSKEIEHQRLSSAVILWCLDLLANRHYELPIELAALLAMQVDVANKLGKAILGKKLFNLKGRLRIQVEVEDVIEKLKSNQALIFKGEILVSVQGNEKSESDKIFTSDELRLIAWASNLMWIINENGCNGIDVLNFIEWAVKKTKEQFQKS